MGLLSGSHLGPRGGFLKNFDSIDWKVLKWSSSPGISISHVLLFCALGGLYACGGSGDTSSDVQVIDAGDDVTDVQAPQDGASSADGTANDDKSQGGSKTTGTNSKANSVPTVVDEVVILPGARCTFGGTELLSGRDDGNPSGTANDGVLQAGEVDARSDVCLTAPDPSKINAVGFDDFPSNTTCKPPTGSSAIGGVKAREVFTNLTFPANSSCTEFTDSDCTNAHRPLSMVQHPTNMDWYLVEQTGRILRFKNDLDLVQEATVVLDISAKVISGYEPGLLSLDFDPSNPTQAYIYYITCESQSTGTADIVCPTEGEQDDVVAAVTRLTMDGSGAFDGSSERLILEVEHGKTEHNGGGARFGPDDMLYLVFGDGGSFPVVAAQDPQSFLGKVLRVDVNDAEGNPLTGETTYRIPADNPFVNDGTVKDEIFATGLRNPWRFDFDEWDGTGLPALFAGDVGLVTAEEVNYVEAGKDYGWPFVEGPFCRTADLYTVFSPDDCSPDTDTHTPPIHWYRQSAGTSITGGFLYRGSPTSANYIPSLENSYVFADFTVGVLYALRKDEGTGQWNRQWLADTPNLIPSFSQSLDGDMYYFDWWSGNIYRLEPEDTTNSKPPSLLSETGCVNPTDPKKPAVGAIPYRPVTPFFSEDAVYKERWFFPAEGSVITEFQETGNLIFQPGTVTMKTFDVGEARIETRLMFRHADGEWVGWSYRWREDQSDAELVESSLSTEVEGVQWHYPDNGECMQCHTFPSGRVLGPRVQQLNGLSYFPGTDRWSNVLGTLRSFSKIERYVGNDPEPTYLQGDEYPEPAALPSYAALDDEEAPLKERVRSYLASNCAHCHRAAGGGRGGFSLLPENFLSVCNATLAANTYDVPEMRVVVPGDADLSMLYLRLVETDLPYQMHPYRITVDTQGAELIRSWIEEDAVQDCPE